LKARFAQRKDKKKDKKLKFKQSPEEKKGASNLQDRY
jgi:hypothetical protein